MISDINRSVITNTNDIEDIMILSYMIILYTAWPTNHFERLYYVSSYFYQRPSAIHYIMYYIAAAHSLLLFYHIGVPAACL